MPCKGSSVSGALSAMAQQALISQVKAHNEFRWADAKVQKYNSNVVVVPRLTLKVITDFINSKIVGKSSRLLLFSPTSEIL